MKVYLDSCSLQRPLDTWSQTRIRLEAEAILGVIAECEARRVELVSSDALVLEAAQNPIALRRQHAHAILEKATVSVTLDEIGKQRARAFVAVGIQPIDALHLASAEVAGCDYFCTCDDRFLRKAKRIRGLKTRTVSPLELAQELRI